MCSLFMYSTCIVTRPMITTLIHTSGKAECTVNDDLGDLPGDPHECVG